MLVKQPLKNLAVGHFLNEPFIAACAPWTARIHEVFFAWPGVLSCRPAPAFTDEVKARLLGDLRWCRERGILLETLFNRTCYWPTPWRRRCATGTPKGSSRTS